MTLPEELRSPTARCAAAPLAGGLVFVAATLDDYLRAFDSATGEERWRGRLPAGGARPRP